MIKHHRHSQLNKILPTILRFFLMKKEQYYFLLSISCTVSQAALSSKRMLSDCPLQMHSPKNTSKSNISLKMAMDY
jgi:hypothetical protein